MSATFDKSQIIRRYFTDPSREESLIIELLEYKHDVAATWFLRDLPNEQDAELEPVIQQSPQSTYRTIPAAAKMAISKGRQGIEARNIVKEVATDVIIVAYEPTTINPLDESAATVGAGLAVPAAQSGRIPMAEVFQLVVSSFKVNDWNLFG